MDPLNIDWEAVQSLVSKARNLKAQFPNNDYISESDKREILEKIVTDIKDLVSVD